MCTLCTSVGLKATSTRRTKTFLSIKVSELNSERFRAVMLTVQDRVKLCLSLITSIQKYLLKIHSKVLTKLENPEDWSAKQTFWSV